MGISLGRKLRSGVTGPQVTEPIGSSFQALRRNSCVLSLPLFLFSKVVAWNALGVSLAPESVRITTQRTGRGLDFVSCRLI